MELPADQPPSVAFTAFSDTWPRAIETEIGTALCAIGHGKGLWLLLTFAKFQNFSNSYLFGTLEYVVLPDGEFLQWEWG